MLSYNQLNNMMIEVLEKHHKNASNKNFGRVSDWVFEIDDIKALGYCNYDNKVITLNRWMVQNSPKEQVLDTLYHECAHALAGLEISNTGRCMGHGKLWKSWARRLGATPKATVPTEKLGEGAAKEFSKPKRAEKYHIVYVSDDSIEIVCSCKRKLKNLGRRGMKNRPETIGNLYHIDISVYDAYNGSNISAMKQKLFR